MTELITLASAGNTEPPAYKLIIDKGYNVERRDNSLVAKKDGLIFLAYSALELLGLIVLFETKGENWGVEDEVIDEYCDLFEN